MTEPDAALLGQKAAGLVQMCRLALPVPPGLVLHSGLWRDVFSRRCETGTAEAGLARDRFLALWPALWQELAASLAQTQLGFPLTAADAPAGERPLVLAVRGGAAQSMPGMLTSILNVGLSAASLPVLATWAGSRRFALDCYARFLQQFCQALLSVGDEAAAAAPGGGRNDWLAQSALGNLVAQSRRDAQHEPPASDAILVSQAQRLRAEFTARTGVIVPDDLPSQLCWAIWGVLCSTDSARTRDYRRLYGLPDDLGTAVLIQAMVYGNLDDRSATGVLFTRDPSTGAARSPSGPEALLSAGSPYGEFLLCAQGEDVVSGTGMPHPLAELSAVAPIAYAELLRHAELLERRLGDMQDIEFTIERGRLWLLQARTGKRSAQAMVRIAADLAKEGIVSPAEALRRVDAGRLVELLHPTIAKDTPRTVVARGLPASPGVAIGPIALSSTEVEAQVRAGSDRPPILVRVDTSPDDIVGIRLSAGVLTARGGLTSHAAVVARGLGRCAVVGTSSLQIDARAGTVQTREHSLGRGDILTLDGHTGEVLLGEVPLSVASLRRNQALHALLTIAAQRRKLRIYAAIDRPADLGLAEALAAEGLVLRRPQAVLRSGDSQALLGPSVEASRPCVICLPAGDFSSLLTAVQGQLARPSGPPLTFLWPAAAVAESQRQPLFSQLRAELQTLATDRGSPSLGLLLSSSEVIAATTAELTALLAGAELLALSPPPDWPRSQGPALAAALTALRHARPELALALCESEPGTPSITPAAVAFCETQGFAFYTSPPLRLPQVAIAAAQARSDEPAG